MGAARRLGPCGAPSGHDGDEGQIHPKRQHTPAQAADGATFRRLAELHAEMSGIYAEFAGDPQIRLADGGDPSVMDPMGSPHGPGAKVPTLLTARDLAERLGVDVRTVRRWRSAGRLPRAIELGGVVRWDPAVVREWIASGGRP